MGDEVLFVRSNKGNDDDEESCMNESDAWDDTVLVEAYDNAVSLAKEEIKRRMGLVDGNTSTSSVELNASTESKKHNKRRWNKTKHTLKQSTQWMLGDACRCVYSADGISYEACIIQLDPGTGTCVVKYVGYDNEENVNVADLQISHGHAARLRQAEEANPGLEPVDCGHTAQTVEEEHSVPEHKIKRNQRTKMDWKSGDHSRSCEYDAPRSSTRHHTNAPFPQQTMMGLPLPIVFPPPPPPHVLGSNDVDDSEALSSMLMSWYMSGFHTGFYQGTKQKGSGCKCSCRRNAY